MIHTPAKAIVLRDYQRNAVAFLLAVKRGILQAPAGSGKTFTAASAIVEGSLRRSGRARVLWIAPTRRVMRSLSESQNVYRDDAKLILVWTVRHGQNFADRIPGAETHTCGGRTIIR